MSDDMRNLFFIVKGQYRRQEPSFVNRVTNDKTYIGGYDPYDDTTEEWYMVLDNKTYHCVSCGSDFKKVIKSVYTNIVKHKGVAKNYFKHVSSITSDDYYETHYLGKRPLTPDQRVKKAEGRCPRVSPVMRCLYEHIYEEYGEFFSDEVKDMEDLAYSELKETTPLGKAKKFKSKTKTEGVVKPQTSKVEVIETPTLKKVRPKARIGMKRL